MTIYLFITQLLILVEWASMRLPPPPTMCSGSLMNTTSGIGNNLTVVQKLINEKNKWTNDSIELLTPKTIFEFDR